jgi:hypothetical protein
MQSTEQWINAAKAELNGADPLKKLLSVKGDIQVKPWYDASDAKRGQSFIL